MAMTLVVFSAAWASAHLIASESDTSLSRSSRRALRRVVPLREGAPSGSRGPLNIGRSQPTLVVADEIRNTSSPISRRPAAFSPARARFSCASCKSTNYCCPSSLNRLTASRTSASAAARSSWATTTRSARLPPARTGNRLARCTRVDRRRSSRRIQCPASRDDQRRGGPGLENNEFV
jgi:hypothetical protein